MRSASWEVREVFRTLLTTETLAEHIADPRWVVADCRFDLAQPEEGERLYHATHIPGAVYAHLDRDLSGPPGSAQGRHPLPDLDDLRARLGGWGR